MYKKLYSLFLQANPGVQHYASHSHHYWPDVTLQAQMNYWHDSARYVDSKWEFFFTNKIPKAQKLISEVLNIDVPEQIVFAPNTHELVYRVISCLDPKKKNKILTTDSEFYSFDRQVNRLSEEQLIDVIKVSVSPIQTFTERFIQTIQQHKDLDLIFFSHVFFNSGLVVSDYEKIVRAVTNPNTIVVIDGYHSFMALPVDLKGVQNRVFFIAGSYKYAQGGEGCCFMCVPQVTKLKPLYTGWFAGKNQMSSEVSYLKNGMRFAGSTMDFTSLYRLIAVLELFKSEGITVDIIHNHVQNLQSKFLNYIKSLNNDLLNLNSLILVEKDFKDFPEHGHFLTFELKSEGLTGELHAWLKDHKVITDYRKNRLRFGFGLYHDAQFDLSCLLSFESKN